MYTSIHGRMEQEQHVIKYEAFFGIGLLFAFFEASPAPPAPPLCPFSAAITAFRFIPLAAHRYCNPITLQPQRVRNHLPLQESFLFLLLASPRLDERPLPIVRLAAALCTMTSGNLVCAIYHICMRGICAAPPPSPTN